MNLFAELLKVIAEYDGTVKKDWETQEGWEKEVAQPVVSYPMSPREARFVLTVFGIMAKYGISPSEWIRHVLLKVCQQGTKKENKS
ncbi:MAG: hypothetical protein GWN00_01480 [Aliifodinibius sp.]|nr:hypothetical protein [Phycisphaerae bacterium]NIR62351.1 hypothetical protein [candidate division Zixibacteria bacterium]NIT54950.1 hypothetical protein [Fodinibius sp.]NIW43362.1 hypothetical protein [Gammaproteobacteria bacterium]NIU12584.1 hypothetical protein [candidate division Zixibacteria bacterium]